MNLDPQETDALAEALATAVTRALVPLLEARDKLLDAIEMARFLGTDRDWVYEHADELGAIRLGDGQRPRLRFDRATALRRLQERPEPQAPRAKHGKEAAPGLLPIRAPRELGSAQKKKRPGGADTPPARQREVSPMQNHGNDEQAA